MSGGAQATKNMMERDGKVAVDSAGKSGADLEQARLANIALTTVGAGKDGARLMQMAADSTHEAEAVD